MAETQDVVEVRNETPLEITINGVRTLAPLEVAEYRRAEVDRLSFGAPQIDGIFLDLARDALPPIVTIDLATVAAASDPGVMTAREFLDLLPDLRADSESLRMLRVTNDTIDVAEAWVLDPTGGRMIDRIGPGESWEHPTQPRLLWHFRTPMGLTLGAFCESSRERTRRLGETSRRLELELAGEVARSTGGAANPAAFRAELRKRVQEGVRAAARAPAEVTLRRGYLEARRAFQQRPIPRGDGRGLSPLRLIGERRSSTPGPDDRAFISVSTVRLDISTEPFNGLENREVRDIEIAGPLLRWSRANPILSGYYGESNAADIRSLTIYCDRMEVADHLRFPRTHVTIYARELVFTGHGKIDTTPLPYPGRATSKYLTEHPDDPTLANVPADAQGNPTYRAADGHKGEPGGNVTVFARALSYEEDPSNTAPWLRFFTRGGKGQQGEAGGLKAYVRGEGQPETYGPLPPVTADQVTRAFKEYFKLDCWHFRWPGNVDWPSLIPDVWQKYNIVEVSVFAYSDGWWLRYLHLPSHTHKAGLPHDIHPGEPAAPRRCNHRDAYPGGWPGEGGDGGHVRLVTEKPADWVASIRDAGAMGDPTSPVKGDAADRATPFHLWIIASDKEVGPQVAPMVGFAGGGSLRGADAPGRTERPYQQELTHDKYLAWTDDSIVDREGNVFATRPNGARRGESDRVVRADLSWAQPAAMTAVLRYARTAYRNGFRDEAARALAPYHALTVLQPEAVAKCSPEVQMAFGSMTALYNNLALDVDYYGNPPGWVPRLDALSNLAALKTVREAAYGTYYFADRMLRDAESLGDLRATALEATKAMKAEMDAAKAQLQTAYEQLPAAMAKLNEAQKLVGEVEAEIVALRKEAVGRSADEVVLQRFVSGALQLVDGVAKSLPVGQPFLGLAGSVFGAAAKIDWTAEKPLETAGAALDHLSGQVKSFVTDRVEDVAKSVTGRLRGAAAAGEDLVTKLTREQEDAAGEPADAVGQVELTWQSFKSEELKRLEAKIKLTEEAIKRVKEGKADDSEPECQTASALLTALQKQKALMSPGRAVAAQVAPLQKELVEYRKRQFELINAAEKVARLKRAELKALADTPKHLLPPTVEQKLTAATRRSEDQKRKLERAEATATETMAKLADLGTGLASVGNAIIAMAAPVPDDDPTVQRLADRLLQSDPELRAAVRRCNEKLGALVAGKKQAAAELLRWQQQATTSLATVMRNLATTSRLARLRQSIDLGLDPAASAYLRETRDAARDVLAESIYWFVKSYQYECLEDVQDGFFDFESWADLLRAQENVRLEQERTKLEQGEPTSEPRSGTGPVVTRARTILLDKEDFARIGEEVFKAEQLKLGKNLLERRQRRRPATPAEYVACELQRTEKPRDAWERRQNEMLDALEQGEVVFDFVRDFAKGSYDWNNARVAQVKLVKLDIEATRPDLSLTFRIEQRGDMVVADRTRDGRRYYLFRVGREDDPVSWKFVYNHKDRKNNSGIVVPAGGEYAPDEMVKRMLGERLTFQEYQPALFSDYAIRITDLYGAGGVRKGLARIRGLALSVFLSEG